MSGGKENIASISVDDITVSDKNLTGGPGQDFSYVPLEEAKKKRVPRHILHFSDGVVEEYSTDEEEPEPEPQPVVNPKKLKWLPWIWYQIGKSATKALAAADICGEKLAWMFGITSPKYQYYIEEYERIKAEEEAERQEQAREAEMEQQRRVEEMGDMEAGDTSEPPPYDSIIPNEPSLSAKFAEEMKY